MRAFMAVVANQVIDADSSRAAGLTYRFQDPLISVIVVLLFVLQ